MEIHELLIYTKKVGASDIHLSTGNPPMVRLDGILHKITETPFNPEIIEKMLTSLISSEQREQFSRNKELDFSFEIQGLCRFRGNLFEQRNGLGASFRVIPNEIKSIDELGFPSVVKDLARMERGLVLVTGATGSGKSTTLASMIDLINTERCGHILTIEDPIEFVHNSKKCLVNQRQVGRETHSFANALRSALREDPDIILVGEMRDLETISLAITAAETGHLVLGTLHTASAHQTVDRIIDVFPAHQQTQVRTQLAECLQGVIAQTLVPLASGKGRIAAVEIMIGTTSVRNLIRDCKTHQLPSFIQTGMQDGMQSLDQSLKALLMAGKIKGEDAYLRAVDKSAFSQYSGKSAFKYVDHFKDAMKKETQEKVKVT